MTTEAEKPWTLAPFQPITAEEAARELRAEATKAQSSIDAHHWGVNVLCHFLVSLGYGDVVRAFEEVPDWWQDDVDGAPPPDDGEQAPAALRVIQGGGEQVAA